MRVRCPFCWSQYDDILDGTHFCAAGKTGHTRPSTGSPLLKVATCVNCLKAESELQEARQQLAEYQDRTINREKSAQSQLTASEERLQIATVAIDRCRREFLSMKLAIRRGVLPHELCDQAAGSQCFAERALEQIKMKSSNTADGLLGESHTGA